ncbi:MAG: hypothetical protein HWE25_04375 [Alphaproteobacteria bacterium]|nr:hypothetical protein [Alphaproteobacteria bacterium]
MIRDQLNKQEGSIEAEVNRPRVAFLWAAAVTSVTAVLAYLFEDMLVGQDNENALGYALLLGLLVLVSMFLVLCYRVPRIGNRLLGYDVASIPKREKEKSSLQYTGSFQVETGLTEKHMNSRRKQARHSRRKLAQVTREMQAEKQQAEPKSDE